jgi:hypothetical protein
LSQNVEKEILTLKGKIQNFRHKNPPQKIKFENERNNTFLFDKKCVEIIVLKQ